jgi:hypothetical protein
MKRVNFIASVAAIACGAMVAASCSSSDSGFTQDDKKQMQAEVYENAFKQEFGTPASNHDWGFGSFQMVEATTPEGSPAIVETAAVGAPRRAVAESVTAVSPVKYNTKEEVLNSETLTAYFFLRIDNKIVQKEVNGTQFNSSNDYYPKPNLDLGNGVKDSQTNTDNQGTVIVAKWKQLGIIDDNKGLSYASVDQPISEEIFAQCPSFETMALHVPDAKKIEIAGSLEAFNSTNYKIFWYVAKWQTNDKFFHVDGVLVPKDQITVNIPEYKKRIIVEDLKGNINSGTQVNGSDFDFNDVVFDAITWNIGGKNHLKIILRAAGGRNPIYVAGKEIHDGVGYMFNTENPDYEYSKVIVEDQIISENASTFDFNSIPVEVEIDGVRTAAGSNIGEAPEKIAVGLDYKWCPERQNIKTVYPRFTNYVSDKTIGNWWK